MEKEMGMKDAMGMQDSTETITAGDPPAAEGRNGPTWRGWVLSILLAIILSVTATLLLGGSSAFQADRAVAAGAGGCGSGSGSTCCPPASAEK
jgi:hypothetical protein